MLVLYLIAMPGPGGAYYPTTGEDESGVPKSIGKGGPFYS